MRPFARLLVASAVGLTTLIPAIAQAKVYINVDLDSQTMHVESKDQTFDWKVSTGKAGYETPNGTYKVLWMDKDHHSDEYEQAPMPNSIFFKPGFAIHGFGNSPWGHAASHGCVRLPVAKSAILFELVKAEGGAEISVTGQTPAEAVVAERTRRHREPAYDDGAQEPRNYQAGAYDQSGNDQRAYDPRYAQRSGYAARGYDGYAGQPAAPQPAAGQDTLFGWLR